MINKENNYIIEPIDNINDFKEVVNIFSEPPFYEPLTEEDIKTEFNLLKDGIILGMYTHTKDIMGYISAIPKIEEKHKMFFKEDIHKLKNLYIYGMATKKEYRGRGICTTLIKTIINEYGSFYDIIYMRVINEGSMSTNLALKCNFKPLLNNGTLALQSVVFKRNNPNIKDEDIRSFLIYPTNSLSQDLLIKNNMIHDEKNEKQKTLVLTNLKEKKYEY